ncbi:GTP-binding protein Era [Catalinimonas alkaloidigena]|uniref:GTPase Era n=1 Tax=Catalinimonas alkaloidigena TaxID=1075417 RepID=A0A1G9E522_9BACT|nr:GTPase Era [Catalinimonas alkaloidigena]SDK71224.1 GTP-binding protein Era [Catalinimonas alkaloidigena]
MEQHKAGFVTIIGKPNVGKSTLMNALIGERLSIITSKAQTTRHRIFGIINGDDFQIVYSDTPGIIEPKYELHKSMMSFVNTSLEDADVILFMTDIYEKFSEEEVVAKVNQAEVPVMLLINKVDQADQETVKEKIAYWQERVKATEIIPVSALHGYNLERVLNFILEHIPHHPPYFPKDQLTDKSERFFASEIIREKILLNYKQEIPYSCEVVIESFKEADDLIRIRAEILVERQSQKGILIGKNGEALKKVGMQARKDMEAFFQKKVFLEQFVKVEPHWRTNRRQLDQLGY